MITGVESPEGKESETGSVAAYRDTGTYSGPRCLAQGCDRPAVADRWCTPHRRGLTLSTALTDVLASFLFLDGEAPKFDERVLEAGELIGKGLELLLSHAFGGEVAVEEQPIKFKDSPDSEKIRWRVSLGWLAQ